MLFQQLLKVEAEKLKQAREKAKAEEAARQGKAVAAGTDPHAAAKAFIAKETAKERRAGDRRISFHKAFILFLLALIGVLGYWMMHAFDEQTGKIEKQRTRAYIMPKTETGESFPANLPFTIKIPVENTGLTPAFGVSAKLWVTVAKYPLPRSVKLEDDGEGRVLLSRPVVIRPGSEDSDVASIRITDSDPIAGQWEELKKNKKIALYVVGTVHYHDTFDVKHYSEFCFGYHTDQEGNLVSFNCRSHDGAD